MGYTVTTAAATVYLSNGAATLLYKGAELPADGELREGEAKRLKDGGFVDSSETVKAAAEAKKSAKAASKAPADSSAS